MTSHQEAPSKYTTEQAGRGALQTTKLRDGQLVQLWTRVLSVGTTTMTTTVDNSSLHRVRKTRFFPGAGAGRMRPEDSALWWGRRGREGSRTHLWEVGGICREGHTAEMGQESEGDLIGLESASVVVPQQSTGGNLASGKPSERECEYSGC